MPRLLLNKSLSDQMPENLTPEEVALSEAIRTDESKARRNLKKLNQIYNRVTGETYEYCLCDTSERSVFYRFYYRWYDKKRN